MNRHAGTGRPQAIFLKADPRAGRPDIPTVPQPHLTASIEGHNSAGRLPAGALFSQNLQHGKPLSSRRWSIKFPCVRHRLISELRPRTETAPPHGNGRRVWNGDSAQPVHRLFAHHAKGRWLCHGTHASTFAQRTCIMNGSLRTNPTTAITKRIVQRRLRCSPSCSWMVCRSRFMAGTPDQDPRKSNESL